VMNEGKVMDSGAGREGMGQSTSKSRSGIGRVVVFIVIPAIIIAAGVAVTMHMLRTSPKAVPRKKPVYETLVEIEKIRFSSHQTYISAMGSVTAAREMDLKPRVGGDVIFVNDELMPGGVLMQGETVLKIDTADYELRVEQLESEVARAEANLALEMGNQRIAKTEFELLGEDADDDERALMLRVPQLRQIEAALKSSVAKLNEAELDLDRTTLQAPFDAIVKAKSVELGARVTESSPVAHLVGTDTFWVEVGVPVEKLSWVRFPDKLNPDSGSQVKIFSGTGSSDFRVGTVVKLAADLEENGRLAKIIVTVEDPLCLNPENEGRPILFLGSYVRVEIEGRELEQVYVLDRSKLRAGSTIWLFGDDSTLEIRPVEPVFKGTSYVLLQHGVAPGEKLVISNIATPVAGMKITLKGQSGRGAGMKGGGGPEMKRPPEGKPPGMKGADGAGQTPERKRPEPGGAGNVE